MAMRSQLRLMIMDARSRDLLGRLKLRRIGPLGEQPPPGAVRTNGSITHSILGCQPSLELEGQD